MSPKHKRPTQAAKILDRLRSGSLTARQAIDEFGITRFSARIFELRRAGHIIKEVGSDAHGFSKFHLFLDL